MLRCMRPRPRGSSTAGCFEFTAQWKTHTRRLAVAGTASQPQSQPQPQDPDDSVANEVKVQQVPIKAKKPQRRFRKVRATTGLLSAEGLSAQEILETKRHNQQIQRALEETGNSGPTSEEMTTLLSDCRKLLKSTNTQVSSVSELATAASSAESLPFEDGDLSGFVEDLSEAVDVQPEDEVEDTDDWDLANVKFSQLPRSPLMDAGFIAARDKHRQPKSDPSKERTEFQSQLEKNPYAIALASPVRRCPVTKAALPKFFLQNFGLLRHPKTGEPYLIPRGMFNANDTQQPDELRMGTGMVGPGMYSLARYPLLQAMNSSDAGFGRDPYLRLFPPRMKEKRAMNLIMQTKFREDMADFILEQARRRIVSLMKYLDATKAMYLAPHHDWDGAKTWAKQVGAYLWTGSRPGAANEPPEFATIESSERPHTHKHEPNGRNGPTRKGKIPVYNLKVLLGEEKMDELRSQCSELDPLIGTRWTSGVFNAPVVTLKHRRPTTSLELQLWWLQGFLAEHNNLLPEMEARELALKKERKAEIEAAIERNMAFQSEPYRSRLKNKE